MASDLLLTKLIPPQPRAGFVARPRLLQRIANPRRGRVTLITAPAGYGKTTVLAEWCAASKTRVAWLALDEGDNDPALFWRYVAAALGVEIGQRQVVRGTAILNLLARTREMVTLVLDDLHVIHSTPILDELGEFIEHAPQTLSIVLSSRTVPELPLARWRARGQLDELETRQLAFTLHEARGFLEKMMQLELEAGMVARLEKMTEGWAAALQLAALSLQTNGAVAETEIGRAHIFEYLASEVFRQQSKARQMFLLETSVLERIRADLADMVLQRTNSAGTLKSLVRANLFISTLDAEGTWYRYHPLFAEFLYKRLRESHPSREKELRRRAAQWFASRGLWAEAIHHALSAGEYEPASVWIDRASETAMEHGQLTTILHWLDELPKQMVAKDTSLGLWYGWVLCLERRFDEMEAHLKNVEKCAARWARSSAYWKIEARIVRGKCAAVRARAAAIQRDETNVFKWSARALRELPEEIRNERSVAWMTRAEAYVWLGKFEEAADAYEQAGQVSRAANHPFIHLGVLFDHARVLAQQGKRVRAQELLKRAILFARENKVEAMAAPAQELLDELTRPPRVSDVQEALSAREREILGWVARGESNPQVATRLKIGVGTVNWHTKNIYRKLGARNRTEAAARAREDGLL